MNIESPAQAVDVNDHNYSVHQIVKGPSPQHRNLDIDPTDSKVSKDIVPSSLDNFSNCELPEITIDDIKDNNDKMLFYTGLPDFGTYKALFESLIQQGADKLVLDSSAMKTETDGKKGGAKRKLRIEDEFFMVLMRLRLGLLLKDLEFRFKISSGRISRIFKTWIQLMCQCLQTIVFLPPLKEMKAIPKCFEKFRDTRIVLDCTEIFVQTPSSLQTQSQTFSNYKGHNTLKSLIGIDKIGAVVFVSRLWGGSVSDTQITRESGLYDLLEEGDAVMVDKGFIHIKGDLSQRGVKLYCPPFLTKNQFTKKEVESTRRIASARIHVERKMEQIKNFRILQGVIPISLCDIVDEVFFVCASLTNLLPPLVK